MPKSNKAKRKWLRLTRGCIALLLALAALATTTVAYAQLLTLEAVQHIVDAIDNPTMELPLIDIPQPSIRFVVLQPDGFKWKYKSIKKEVDCLAKNVYFEARHEPEAGQLAVILVTLNRVKSALYPDSVCGVVWEKRRAKKTGHWTAMFSWTLDGRADKPRDPVLWQHSVELAEHAIGNKSLDNIPDFTEGATHYHAEYVHPKWRFSLDRIVQIGLHIFYRDPKAVVAL